LSEAERVTLWPVTITTRQEVQPGKITDQGDLFSVFAHLTGHVLDAVGQQVLVCR
jgi:hypothetical protein